MSQNKQNLDRFKMEFWDGRYMAKVISLNIEDNYAVVSYSYADEYTPDEEVELSSGILRQCTELKDKNGKLIFEGDIIQHTLIHKDGTEELEDCNFTQIQFRKGMFCFVINAGTKDEYCESMFVEWGEKWEPNFAVIGNIYEDKHLINQ